MWPGGHTLGGREGAQAIAAATARVPTQVAECVRHPDGKKRAGEAICRLEICRLEICRLEICRLEIASPCLATPWVMDALPQRRDERRGHACHGRAHGERHLASLLGQQPRDAVETPVGGSPVQRRIAQ